MLRRKAQQPILRECQPFKNDSGAHFTDVDLLRQLFDATGDTNGAVVWRVPFVGQFGSRQCVSVCICPLHSGVGGQLMARQDL